MRAEVSGIEGGRSARGEGGRLGAELAALRCCVTRTEGGGCALHMPRTLRQPSRSTLHPPLTSSASIARW